MLKSIGWNFLLLLVAAPVWALQPGGQAGWPATSQPAQRGNKENPFYNERAIARWSVVPYQTYSEKMPIGVVAFHGCGQERGSEGIEKVEFIANNGEAVTVTNPSKHPITGRWEWWTHLEPMGSDGLVEVRAIIYPFDGVPRVLQGGSRTSLGVRDSLPTNEESLLLWSNAKRTFTRDPLWVAPDGNDSTGNGSRSAPYATIEQALISLGKDADFRSIYLQPGTYAMLREDLDIQRNRSGWTTIQPAPGVARDKVILNRGSSAGRTRFKLLHFKDVTLDCSGSGLALVRPSSSSATLFVWLEGIRIFGADNTVKFSENNGRFSEVTSGLRAWYLTESKNNRCEWSQFDGGPIGFMIATGVDIHDCSGDVFSRSKFIRDFTVRDHKHLEDQHSDLWQSYGTGVNRILLDGTAINAGLQMLFLDNGLKDNTDMIIANVLMSQGYTNYRAQGGNQCRHQLIWHVAIHNEIFWLRAGGNEVPGPLGIYGCIFESLSIDSGLDTRTFHFNYIQYEPTSKVKSFGDNPIVREADYNDEMRPTDAARVPRIIRWDAFQVARQPTTTAGPFQRTNRLLPPGGLRIVQ